ncbi:MAG: protein kinase [Planctomycetaceae bacterium]|nr:protein kinase [Planctomycetaceae bacterium]
MNPPDRIDATRSGLTPDMMLCLNRHCDRREAQWRATAAPSSQPAPSEMATTPISLRQFLESIPEAEQVYTAPELILIDLAYSVERDLPCSVDDLQQQVPWIDSSWLKDQVTRALADKELDPLRQSRGTRAKVGNQRNAPAPRATAPPEKLESPLDAPDVHQLGDYLITGTIGRGGMGHVYRAVHKIMGRVVAIKTMQKARANDLPARRRFEREVQVLAKLSHPNIVTAFDAREHDDVLYLVTELIEGEDLAKLVARKGRLRPREAMFFIWQAAKGLAYAHQQGIIHRDIKPSNLILEKKRTIKVLDLGLARLRQVETGESDDSTLTDSCRVLGTARYMAPEQARSAMTADERADIYSLGCTLYFVLTGQPPFRGETEIDTILAHSQEPIPDLPTEIAGRLVPDGLRQLVYAMMAKLPDERPQTMSQVIETLEELIRQEQERTSHEATSISEPIVPLLQIADRTSSDHRSDVRRQRRRYLLGGASAGLLSIAGGWYFWPQSSDSPTKPTLPQDPVQSIGLSFDGLSQYVEVLNFAQEAAAPFLIQLAATPRWQRNPANLVSWTGKNWVALFMAENGCWGLGWLNAGRSRLIVTRDPVSRDQQCLVAGWCDGQEMRLFINGQPAVTQPLEYELLETPPGLYIGGMPPKSLPNGHGVRYFHGDVLSVRIDMGLAEPAVATTPAELNIPSAHTLICLPFSEGQGTTTADRSQNQYVGRIENAVWRTADR